jgi:ribA/ribD-fused uncharacterized protein
MLYRENDVAFFYRTADENGELSNMHGHFPIVWENRKWRSSEALYQSLRFPGNCAIHDQINEQPNAIFAKRKAYEFKELTRPDWQLVKIPNMEKVLRLKTYQHFPHMAAILDLTRDRDIVEKSKNDDFWGARPDGNGNLIGQNVLGLLWMLIREEISAGQFHVRVELDL